MYYVKINSEANNKAPLCLGFLAGPSLIVVRKCPALNDYWFIPGRLLLSYQQPLVKCKSSLRVSKIGNLNGPGIALLLLPGALSRSNVHTP
jgi:hypothetical protein